jgi:hypothetical protein
MARTRTHIREPLVKLVSVVLDFVTVSCVAKLVVVNPRLNDSIPLGLR